MRSGAVCANAAKGSLFLVTHKEENYEIYTILITKAEASLMYYTHTCLPKYILIITP